MSPSTDDRGVSTVIDVAMALMLISASVLIIGFYLNDASSQEDLDPDETAHVAQVLSESTISATYSVEDVKTDDDNFSEPPIVDETTYTRTDHGTALGLLADAAVTNHQVGGQPILAYGHEYEDAVDASIGGNLVGANTQFYIVAEWEPYEGAGINGTATAGERPPADADVGSVTMTAPSRLPEVNETELEDRWRNADDWWDEWIDDNSAWFPDIDDSSDVPGLEGSDNKSYHAAGLVIGEAVVDGLFPPEASQYALENQGINRELKVYHYNAVVEAVGDFSFRSADTEPPLYRPEADATQANRNVLVGQEGGYDVTDADALGAWIGNDLPRAFDEEFEQAESDDEKIEIVTEALSNGDVTITIQTWTQ